MNKFFEVIQNDNKTAARLGILHLAHGDVETPVFMPVGTQGTVKGVYHDTLRKIGYKLILGNTYHLYLRPGCEVLSKYGGLHKFSTWDRNILTDSGGFQVFSLSKLRKITDEGVKFSSHIDGSKHLFTPESVIDTEGVIGSDIAMCLDVCTPYGENEKKSREAMYRTHAWAERAIHHYEYLKENNLPHPHSLFGIVQGNFYKNLRKQSAEFINSLPFDGIAIGGLSVGEDDDTFVEYLRYTSPLIDKTRPHYVMGIGTPEYIFEAVENGIDMFDCVLATRIARHGTAFRDSGDISLTKSPFRGKDEPIDPTCTCTACKEYSLGYIHHLFKANEMLGSMLLSEHNLTYLYNLVERIKESIKNGTFKEFKREYLLMRKG